jgi:hypothetical protein
VAARAGTGLAAVLVMAALLLPDRVERLTPGTFTRIPVEAIGGVALLLVLPARARRVVAALTGAGLGLVTLLNVLDMGFRSVLARPFDPVLDWVLFDDAESFLSDSMGPAVATTAVIGAGVLVVALLVSMALSVVRLSRVVVRHRAVATPAVLVSGTVWVLCAALGVQVSGAAVASRGAADVVSGRVQQVRRDGGPGGVRRGGRRRRVP